ncbi:MAG: tyrosine-type recombinase/integrase [Ignavibacteriaceae bacterium]|jgi:site-specific recombinase XerD|nr:tyrosine-type recombinase/integrase [Ignavibacteriaceae bacterium]
MRKSKLRFDKQGSPYIYIRYDEDGKRVEKSTSILKENRDMAYQFQTIFDYERMQKNANPEHIAPNAPLQSAFDHFLRNNKQKNKKTIYEYNNFFKKLAKVFPPGSDCSTLTKYTVENFLNEVKEWKYAHNTKANICKNMKKFLNFLFEYSYIPNAFRLNKDVITSPKISTIIIFSSEDISKIFAALKKKNTNFQTMMLMLFYTGLRPTDIYKIEVKEIDLAKEIFLYYSQKGKIEKIRPIHSMLVPVLTKRVSEVKHGRIINYSGTDEMGTAFRRFLKDVKLIGKGYTLRTPRKTFETIAFEQSARVESVAELVGHSPETAARHYRRISTDEMRKDLEKVTFSEKVGQ